MIPLFYTLTVSFLVEWLNVLVFANPIDNFNVYIGLLNIPMSVITFFDICCFFQMFTISFKVTTEMYSSFATSSVHPLFEKIQ